MLPRQQFRVNVVACVCLLLGALLVAFPSWRMASAATCVGQEPAQQSMLSDETATKIKQVVQTLKRAALDEDQAIRIAAVSSLPMFAQYDAEIVDVLWQAAGSSEPTIRQAGINAIIASEDSSDKTIDALLVLSGDDELDQPTRDHIRERLSQIGAAAVVPRAVAAIEGDHPIAKQQAIAILVSFGIHSQPAVEPLLTVGMSTEESVELRASALTMAAQITSEVALQERHQNALRAEAETQAIALLERYDANGDGNLAFDGSEGITASKFAEFDQDKSGTLDKTELTAFCLNQRQLSRARSSRDRTGRGGFITPLERAFEDQRVRGEEIQNGPDFAPGRGGDPR